VSVVSEVFSSAFAPVQIEWFIPFLKEISVDENAAVKVLAIEGYESITKSLHGSGSSALLVSEIVPLIKAAAIDESWRVRYAIAKMYGSVVSYVPADVCKSELFPVAIKLLMDNETDTRVMLCDNILPYFNITGGEAFLSEIVPIAQLLADDTVVNVRKASANMLVTLATKCAHESNAQQVNELVTKIMDDEDPLVRLRLIKNLDLIAAELPTLCGQLTATLKSHFQDKNWRVRKYLVEAMPAILRQMGQEFFTDNYVADFLPSLGDEVEEVRTSAAKMLPLLASASTPLWIQETIFPTIKALSTEGDFIHRISFLNSLRALMEIELPESFQTEVISLMMSSANDGVPNVRLRAAQVLGFTASKLGEEGSRTQIRPVLNELAQDKDRDVQYFANEALKAC
jgi:serine/threonine-protein phosphatase 2A regulatory subunit A